MKLAKAPPPVSDINVTPMVDVMLVMLIIFMVITPMLSKGVSVDLVKTKNPIPCRPPTRKTRSSWRSRATERPYLEHDSDASRMIWPQRSRICSPNRLDKTWCSSRPIRGPRYERVVEVVDNLRAAGVDQLGLLTEQIQERASPLPRPHRRASEQGILVKHKEHYYGNGSWRVGGGPKADINMTPMIDVLLVLIIIFMVITPLTPKGLEALVPQPPPPNQKTDAVGPADRGDCRQPRPDPDDQPGSHR